VDEAILLRAPTSIGPDGIDALEGRPLEALTRSDRLVLTSSEAVGADTMERYQRR
jgi:diaminohydroxyphosphoribosylaminopyrimidine deaminase / 5-amino-6-(5-phosphoribosylamino)uracil reductase